MITASHIHTRTFPSYLMTACLAVLCFGSAVIDTGRVAAAIQTNDGNAVVGSTDSRELSQSDTIESGSFSVDGDYRRSDSVVVVPAEVAYIRIAPPSNTLEEGDTFGYRVYSYDTDSNLVGDVTDDATWSTSDASGSIDAAGNYTAGTDISPPDLYVYADYATFRDSSVVTVITNGALSYVQIECEDGTVFADTVLTTDNDTTILCCRGYDSGDNLLGDFSVNWTRIDTSGIANHSPSGGIETTLSLYSTTASGSCSPIFSATSLPTNGLVIMLYAIFKT